ncbi:Uncharacterised protein [Actinomyces bovis]|uniref:Uncharacterized protein n=1 Tax=Actinomyces bovis TaxID=1658 RepID=A0ABY1VNF1_9ACTO|nr:Uncharacterised protein [Actinomyces bovis]VEG55338.1 Uncharacterised protein [Actinomyces israelii]
MIVEVGSKAAEAANNAAQEAADSATGSGPEAEL